MVGPERRERRIGIKMSVFAFDTLDGDVEKEIKLRTTGTMLTIKPVSPFFSSSDAAADGSFVVSTLFIFWQKHHHSFIPSSLFCEMTWERSLILIGLVRAVCTVQYTLLPYCATTVRKVLTVLRCQIQ